MRTDKFKMIPETVLLDERVTKNDLLVYCGLLQFKNNKTQRAFPSIATLCKISRLSKNPVKTSLKHLAELGYIEISRRFDKVTNSYTSNVYTLLDASKIDIEPLYKEKGYEKEVEEVKVEAKKPEPKKAPKKKVEDTQIVCISSSPKKVEEVVEEDNKSMHDRALEEEAKETKELEILEEVTMEEQVETMEEVNVENTRPEYDDEEEEEFSKNWAYQSRFNKARGVEYKPKKEKPKKKMTGAVELLFSGVKSSKITY